MSRAGAIPRSVVSKVAHLGVAVLLDDEHLIMVADELGDFGRERKGADAQRVDMKAVARQQGLSLVHRRRGRSVVDDADPRRLCRGFKNRTRQEAARGFEFAQQALHIVDVRTGFLGVAGEAVATGAAGEIGAERRMRAGQGAIGDAVAVDVVVAAEFGKPFQFIAASAPCRDRRRAHRPSGTAR